MQKTLRGITIWIGVAVACVASQAAASEGTCTPEVARSEAAALVAKIAAAPSVEEARSLALQPTRGAHLALSQARRIAPWTESLKTADGRITRYEASVAAATSPDGVAQEFAALIGAGNNLPGGIQADLGDGGCDYSTGEIIATVLGFILGIIPGIILLFLLC